MLIIKKLGKDKKFLSKELKSEINSSIHYAATMCSNRISYVTNIYGIQMFVVRGPFYKYLCKIKKKRIYL